MEDMDVTILQTQFVCSDLRGRASSSQVSYRSDNCIVNFLLLFCLHLIPEGHLVYKLKKLRLPVPYNCL